MLVKRLLVGLASCCLLSACATPRSVPLPAAHVAQLPEIHRDERIVLTLRNGEKHKLKVVSVEADHLLGREKGTTHAQRFDYADIESLEVYRRSTGSKVTLAVLTTLGVVVVAAVAVVMEIAIHNHD
jgi:hypothetical protein